MIGLVDVRLEKVTKLFDEVVAANKVSLQIKDGEFFTLLGPSGCGKTTTLRIVAGFIQQDEGDVYFGDRLMNDVPPNKRNTGMVFQTYAVWPHMNTFDNISFGLDLRKVSKEEKSSRVTEVLRLVGMEGMEKRFPSQLSGGQQQRVALARALVIEPEVLLLDEPLSNLDAKLRVQTRTEIKKLQKELKITTLYVTHDQEEALSISDRIAIQNKGSIQQVGIPRAIYEDPSNKFIADFIGIANFIDGKLIDIDEKNQVVVVSTDYGVNIISKIHGEEGLQKGMTVLASIRPEAIAVYEPKTRHKDSNNIDGEVRLTTYLGSLARYEIQTPWGSTLQADVYNPRHSHVFREGEKVSAVFAAEDVKLIRLE